MTLRDILARLEWVCEAIEDGEPSTCARARRRLGLPEWRIRRERGRDLAHYTREHGGRR